MAHQRQRVLFHPYFFLPESWNGIDEHLLLLAKYLDRRLFELLVIAHEGDGPQTRVLSKRAGIRLIEAPYRAGAGARERMRALRCLYRAEQIDLVHLHSPVAGGQLVASLAARMAGVRATVATYHQIQPARLPSKSRAVSYLTHALLVDRILAVSNDVKKSLTMAAAIPDGRIQVVHNGIENPELTGACESFGTPDREVVRIGYFGRLSPEKGVPDLLRGLAHLAPRCPKARTIIVGDGPDRQFLQVLAKELGIDDRVEFLGFRADARNLMDQVDLVAHVPVYEGFGIVILEAMAASRPVVVNDAPGGLPEVVVHGETGLVVPARDPESLAWALAYLVDAPQERVRLGQNGRMRREQLFSAQGMADRIAATYDEALGVTSVPSTTGMCSDQHPVGSSVEATSK